MAVALICGYVVDRLGSWATVRLGTAFETVTLALVTLAPFLGLPYVIYLIAFALLGFVTASSWWTFTAYLMDIAETDRRPAYLAASGVLKSPVFVASVAVGALYSRTSPEVIFGIALTFALGAFITSLTLARVRAGVTLDAR